MEKLTVLSVERGEGIATVWLDRAEARNAMGPAFFEELPRAMEVVEADPEVRAVVIAARGPHFSVGLDLKAMWSLLGGSPADGRSPASPARRASAVRREVLRLQASITAVADCPKPVIAALHGYCIGGAIDLASACDVRVASKDATISVRETRVAIVADLGSLQRLPGIIGTGQVAELALTGKDITADHAMRIGLVNSVHPDAASAQAAALAMAAEMAANSPLAVQGTKAVLRASRGRSVAEGLDYVATWNAGFLQSDDLVEAMTAFMAKRPPVFRGS